MSDDKIESLLKKVAPHLAATKAPPLQPPPHVVARLNKSLQAIFQETQSLSANDMRFVILKLLTQQQQMDGVQITAALKKARLGLEGAGEGAIYGLLRDLTDAGFLEAKLEPAEARIKVYQITKDGRALLSGKVSKSSQLSIWFERIVEGSP